MCGIAGFINPQKNASPEALEQTGAKMAQALSHRGPDHQGVWVDAGQGIALAHRRLSIIDLSEDAHQPMISADGRYVMVFNGEIYNFKDLRKTLEQGGKTFKTDSDTEVLLEALASLGVQKTLSEISGMFAFALWDRSEKTLTMAVDPVGKKPIYYGFVGKNFVFGSELKALLTLPEFKRDINPDIISTYTRFGYIPAPHSIFKSIHKMSPGSYLTLDESALTSKKLAAPVAYFSAERLVNAPKSGFANDADAIEFMRGKLQTAIKNRLISDVPLGAFLSGGIDSSLIVAMMQEHSSKPVQTFSVGFAESGFDESEYAAKIAAQLGTQHTAFHVTPQEAREIIPQLPDIYDEPFADMSQIPTWHICRLARKHVTVALSGDGGDEFFGGYSRYFLTMKADSVPYPLRSLLGKVLGFTPPARLKAIGTALQEKNFAKLYAHTLAATAQPQTYLSEDYQHSADLKVIEAASKWEAMMLSDIETYLPGDILTKVDRASMSHGLEVRCPLLDKDVISAALSLPLDYKIREGKGKWLLREILAGYIDRAMFERPKMGFGVPMAAWLRGPLKEWAGDVLATSELQKYGIFDAKAVETAWHDHLSGRADNHYLLYHIITMQAWAQRYL